MFKYLLKTNIFHCPINSDSPTRIYNQVKSYPKHDRPNQCSGNGMLASEGSLASGNGMLASEGSLLKLRHRIL